MKYLITVLLIIILALTVTISLKGDDMPRAISNKMLGCKPTLNTPGLQTFSVGKSQILPVQDTSQIKQTVIQAAVANFTQSVYAPPPVITGGNVSSGALGLPNTGWWERMHNKPYVPSPHW